MKPSAKIEKDAAEWLARREGRELSPSEKDAFESWLAADARHRAAFLELESAWRIFDTLADYPRSTEAPDDPDFFARPKRFRRVARVLFAATAVAAAAVFGLYRRTSVEPPVQPRSVAQENTSQLMLLPDGSEVELRPGSVVEEQFSPAVRHVRLVRGEAQFTVMKDPNRPFIVESGGVAVRAVGTVFNVRLDDDSVEVLVTEGRVGVNPPAVSASNGQVKPPIFVAAGQRTVVSIHGAIPTAPAVVETVSPQKIDRLLAWQSSRLVFDAMPLSEVLARFNRHVGGRNRARLILADPDLAGLRISGRLRADNETGFVELLETSFGISCERRGDSIILRKAP